MGFRSHFDSDVGATVAYRPGDERRAHLVYEFAGT